MREYGDFIEDIENIQTDSKRMLINIDDVIEKAMEEDFWSYDAKVNCLHYGYKEFQLFAIFFIVALGAISLLVKGI